MKRIPKMIAMAALCLSAHQALAQLGTTTTKVVEILPREWGMHIRIEPAAASSLTSGGVACPVNINPAYMADKADYKTVKDSILLAYSLKKTIRLYFDLNPTNLAVTPLCLYGNYPRIYAIDVLEN